MGKFFSIAYTDVTKSLITLPRFAMAVPSMPVKRWNFRKAKRSHYIALTNTVNSQRLCCRLIHLMCMRLTRTSVTPLRKQPKRLSHAGIKITIFRVGMQSVNLSIKPFCSLLRETTQVWLIQFCLPSLTESRGIDGPKQFGACPIHRAPHGARGLTVLDDETRCWLNNTTASI